MKKAHQMMMNGRKAFILKDYLLALLIILMMFPIITQAFKSLNSYNYFDQELSDYLSLEQLKRKLYLCEDVYFVNNQLTYVDENIEWTLNYNGKDLYLSPGYQLFLSNVKNLYYDIIDNKVYLFYTKNNKHYHKAIKKLC